MNLFTWKNKYRFLERSFLSYSSILFSKLTDEQEILNEVQTYYILFVERINIHNN